MRLPAACSPVCGYNTQQGCCRTGTRADGSMNLQNVRRQILLRTVDARLVLPMTLLLASCSLQIHRYMTLARRAPACAAPYHVNCPREKQTTCPYEQLQAGYRGLL